MDISAISFPSFCFAQARTLLDKTTPITPNYTHLFHVNFKGTRGLALWASAWSNLLVLPLKKGAQNIAALETVVPHHVELWENGRAGSDHSFGTDQLVEVELSVVAERGGWGSGRGRRTEKKGGINE